MMMCLGLSSPGFPVAEPEAESLCAIVLLESECKLKEHTETQGEMLRGSVFKLAAAKCNGLQDLTALPRCCTN